LDINSHEIREFVKPRLRGGNTIRKCLEEITCTHSNGVK
jgi:hypothetical protein